MIDLDKKLHGALQPHIEATHAGCLDNSAVVQIPQLHVFLPAHQKSSAEGMRVSDVTYLILQPFGLSDTQASRFSIKGENVRLLPKTALTFAMVFHELATNATKYGALSKDASGKVEITWQIEAGSAGNILRLRWQESGGPVVTPPTRKGFGSRLIETGLAHELDGEVNIDYIPTGIVCKIAMPIITEGEKL